jgi:hypothetical protein
MAYTSTVTEILSLVEYSIPLLLSSTMNLLLQL